MSFADSSVPSDELGMPSRALVRMAITGIYLVRDVPRELQRTARVRAVSEGTTLRRVLVRALREYAAGTWTRGRTTSMSETLVQMVPMLALAGSSPRGWPRRSRAPAATGSSPIRSWVSRQHDRGRGRVGRHLARPAMTTMLVVGGVGAGLAILAQRGLWRSARLAT